MSDRQSVLPHLALEAPGQRQFKPMDRNTETRRGFLASLAGAVAVASVGQSCRPSAPLADRPGLDLSAVPNFCSHEHWGSIASIGRTLEGFRADVEQGALPDRDTGVFDLLLDPYFTGMLRAGGTAPDQLAIDHGADDFSSLVASSPEKAWQVLQTALSRYELTGTYQCTRRGILNLYGVDISNADWGALSQLSETINENYKQPFNWYRKVMQRAHFTELVRPVHPEYYVRRASAQTAAQESSFTHTVMRVDPLLGWWSMTDLRRDGLAEIASVEPHDATTWRAFIEKLFNLAADHGAVGIKQLQAYSRPLEYQVRGDGQIRWRGELDPEQVRVFQDWVMHECCRQAHERGWVHQVHVGTHNITQSSPMPLRELAHRYPRMKIVMIHCWPFLEEAGWLAKYVPNIAIDSCWQLILDPEFYRQSMTMWLNYVPLHKITCSHDATSVEMAVGSSLFTREILGKTLVDFSQNAGVNEVTLLRAATDLMHNNSVEIYGVGERKRFDGRAALSFSSE